MRDKPANLLRRQCRDDVPHRLYTTGMPIADMVTMKFIVSTNGASNNIWNKNKSVSSINDKRNARLCASMK